MNRPPTLLSFHATSIWCISWPSLSSSFLLSTSTSHQSVIALMMYLPSLVASALLTTTVAAKRCQNFSVPVTLSARNGIFNVPTLLDNDDATTFTANFTKPGGNFSNEVLLGYQTISNTYDISVKFCQPDAGGGPDPTVQFLTHGIGFDKS